MAMVEVRITPADVVQRTDEIRRWLAGRACVHKLTSTGSSEEMLVLVEFAADADASEFARQFAGSLLPS